MANVGDQYVFHSVNGLEYTINIVNVNLFREPSMKYAADVFDNNGTYAGDVMFFGDAFIDKCKKINK